MCDIYIRIRFSELLYFIYHEKLIAIFGNRYKLIGVCDVAENFNDHESLYLKPLLIDLMKIYKELNIKTSDLFLLRYKS